MIAISRPSFSPHLEKSILNLQTSKGKRERCRSSSNLDILFVVPIWRKKTFWVYDVIRVVKILLYWTKGSKYCQKIYISVNVVLVDFTMFVKKCHATCVMCIISCSCALWIFIFRANKANQIHPELPVVTRCHAYDIETKYKYKCNGCGHM